LVDLCDFGKGFGAPAGLSEENGPILVCAAVARRQGNGSVELSLGGLAVPIKLPIQYAKCVVGFADGVVQLQCFS